MNSATVELTAPDISCAKCKDNIEGDLSGERLGARRGPAGAARPAVLASGSRGAAAGRAAAGCLPALDARHLGPGTVDTARRAGTGRDRPGTAWCPRGQQGAGVG